MSRRRTRLAATLARFDPKEYDAAACRAQAEQFSAQAFRSKLSRFLEQVLQGENPVASTTKPAASSDHGASCQSGRSYAAAGGCPCCWSRLVALFSLVQMRPWQPAPPAYTASLRMLVGVLPAAEADVAAYDPRYYAWLTSEYLVDDFTEVVRSGLFAGQRQQAAGAARHPAAARRDPGQRRHGQAAPHHHALLHLAQCRGVGGHCPSRGRRIDARTRALYFQQLGTDGAGVTLLDGPVVSAGRPGPARPAGVAAAPAARALVGLGLVFLLDYLDTSIRARTELEEMGYAILGEIPKHR